MDGLTSQCFRMAGRPLVARTEISVKVTQSKPDATLAGLGDAGTHRASPGDLPIEWRRR